jgi:hypothetical protein
MDPQEAEKKISELNTEMRDLLGKAEQEITPEIQQEAIKIQQEALKMKLHKVDSVSLARIELLCLLTAKF